MIIHSGIPQLAFIVPQGKGRARGYLGYRVEADYRVRGEAAPASLHRGVRPLRDTPGILRRLTGCRAAGDVQWR
jgi:hypothetical protein